MYNRTLLLHHKAIIIIIIIKRVVVGVIILWNEMKHSVTLFFGTEQSFIASVDIYCSSAVPYSYINVQL